MSASVLPAQLRRVERKLRVVAILTYCHASGLIPVRTATLHTMAYLTDALAPVWHLPVLDGQVLKKTGRPFFPVLQEDVDDLVGAGVLDVVRMEYLQIDGGKGWRMDADYKLAPQFAGRVMKVALSSSELVRRIEMTREVVYAASGLGEESIEDIGAIDAAYSDPVLSFGNVLDVTTQDGEVNASARAAIEFSRLSEGPGDLSSAELVHLYVRHLYSRIRVA
jgi:hypothetical protein